MHLSNDVAATDSDNFELGNECLSAADVKCELKMEIDEKNLWSDVGQQRPPSNSTSDAPVEERETGLREIRQADVDPCLRSRASSSGTQTGPKQTGEQHLYPVSRLSSFVGSFHDELQRPCPKPLRKEFGNSSSMSSVPAGCDRTLSESYRDSRSSRKESQQRVDGTRDQRAPVGSQHHSSGDAATGQVSEIAVVGHQTGSRNRVDELILSTPFGTFHRAPLSFWPAKSAEEQCTGIGHYSNTITDRTSAVDLDVDICDHDQLSSDKRGSRNLSSRNVTAVGNESKMPGKVITRLY